MSDLLVPLDAAIDMDPENRAAQVRTLGFCRHLADLVSLTLSQPSASFLLGALNRVGGDAAIVALRTDVISFHCTGSSEQHCSCWSKADLRPWKVTIL